MVAEIILNSNVKNLNRTFDYQIPVELEKTISVGSSVLVPFGNIKKLEEGFVIRIKENSDYKLKSIEKVQEKKYLNEEKIKLAQIMARRYFCNISDCIKLMLPPGTTTKKIENRINDKFAKFVYLAKDEEIIEQSILSKEIKSEKQIRTLRFLLDNDEVSLSELQMFADVSAAIIKTLKKNGYIEIIEKQVERNPFINKNIEKTTNLKLTEEQQKAYKQIASSIESNKYEEFLLFGVTGSGKTEVYIQLIQKVLEKNKSSIMLVPEISLTPQTVSRFISRFGEEKIAVLHSKLSIGERYDQWKKIERGDAKIVIGARSAMFAPVKDLGLIIIDEEHDESYKSETNPRYNVKDIASYIARKNSAPVVLGSATPDLKTYSKALSGKIKLVELTKRANNSNLPQVEIVDLRQELAKGNKSMFSNKLYQMIKQNIENKKQTILFLNRRGFSTFVMCRDCGYTLKCKNCNIALTYHLKENKLKCHYCGYEKASVSICPECKSKNIRYFGTGTQKLETEINKLFPDAKTIRMDVDTVSKKNSHEDILNRFKNENIDILIGTQMVVKGHHFPNVTLVGVIAADSSLNIEDYRANERTFQILTQVAGRAGREKEKGNVIVQTYNPDNFCIECAKEQDYKKFYKAEIQIRKQLRYPPFCDIILVGISGKNKKQVEEGANRLYKYLNISKKSLEMDIYKPVPAPIDRIKNKTRWRIIIKCKLNENIVTMLNEVLNKSSNEILKNLDIKISCDINPNNMI